LSCCAADRHSTSVESTPPLNATATRPIAQDLIGDAL
jgi:hypothetical protein